MIIGIQKINLQIQMGAENLGEVVLHFLCIEMVDSGDTKHYILILSKQDDSGEIKGRKEVNSTSPHFVVHLLCVSFLALKAVLDIQ